MSDTHIKVAIASDHAGQGLRSVVSAHVLQLGHQVRDLGYDGKGAVDYPDFAQKVCELVASKECSLGILVCGTGIGVSMAAQAYPGMRAALCINEFMVRMARAHNDANILCLGERVIGVGTALSCVDVFLNTTYAAGRHVARLDKVAKLRTC